MSDKIAPKGLTIDGLKRNPSLLPLFVFVGVAVTAATLYTGRMFMKNPEVSINKGGNPTPWEEYRNKQYKFFEPGQTEGAAASQAPKY